MQRIQGDVLRKWGKVIVIFQKLIKKIRTALKVLKQYGFAHMIKVIRSVYLRRFSSNRYMKSNVTTLKQRKLEESKYFKCAPKISILVPLYNTPKRFLSEMLESALDQTYKNLELCLADGSDDQHAYVREICERYASTDKRIKYVKNNDGNLGISENTNRCIEIATGDYIGLLDHDDLLHCSALYDVVCEINKSNADFIYTDECSFDHDMLNPKNIHMKPDFSPDTLRSYNYICHFSVFSRELLDKVGYFSKDHDGSQDYDLVLRLTEKAKHVAHIPRVLYFWRIHKGSVASDISVKPYCVKSAKKAIKDQLNRLSIKGEVNDSKVVTTYKVDYEIKGEPLVSIIIPNMDHIKDLRRCVNSIVHKSTYKNFEIIIVENNSKNKETLSYYYKLQENQKIKVVKYEGDFNYPRINNFGVKNSNGEYIILLNNDTCVITPDWIEQMLMFAQRKDVGAVGAKLLFNDDTVQHAGVILGINHVAGHAHKGWKDTDDGYAARLTIAQNFSAVTAACLMTRRDVFDELNGLDEEFKVAFNDVDMCLRIKKKGYLIVYTPYAKLYHYESKSRGYDVGDTEKVERYKREEKLLQDRWNYELHNDPYYNKNLTLKREDFSLKDKDEL